MAWTDVTASYNQWDEQNNLLYVVADYWVDGYTLDIGSQWTATNVGNNNWSDVTTSNNDWTVSSGSSNTWVVIG